MSTRLLLVRHAQTSEETRGRVHGRLDAGLSPDGRRQARALARELRATALDAVYTSPSRRAVETATPIAAAHELAPVADERLREIDFGDLEGRRFEDIERSHPDLYREWMTTPARVRFPAGESYRDLRRRALAAMGALRERHPGGTIAVVTHAGVVRALLAKCLAMPASAIFRLDVAHAAVSVVDWVDATPIVRAVNAGALDVGPAR
jgi:alpha-ribazole phosphatase